MPFSYSTNIIPSCRITFQKRLLPILILVVAITFAGCKTHKKNQQEDIVSEVTIKKSKKQQNKERQELGKKIAKEAISWVGTPYGYGKSDKGRATDCSGLVLVVFEKIANVKMPRNSAKQAEFCKPLKDNEVEAGDLVFFATGRDVNQISHVGVMIDERKFVHSSSSKGVIVSDMDTPYYIRTFKKYGRVPLD